MDTAALVVISLVVLVIVVAVLAVLWSASNTARSKLEDDNAELKRQLNIAKTSLTDKQTKLDSNKAQLLTLKGTHKKAKQKLHRLSQDQKAVGQGGITKVADQDALAENRYELANARSEIESLNDTVRQLTARLAEKQRPASTKTTQKDDGPPVDRAAVETEIRQDFQDRLRAARAELSLKKKESADEGRELKKRLSNALRDSDKHRRRADNNEKAYEITKTQLEKALDRLHRFDPSVPRPFKAPPKPATKRGDKKEPQKQEEPTTETSTEDPEPTEEKKKAPARKKTAGKPADDVEKVSEQSPEKIEDTKVEEPPEETDESKAEPDKVDEPAEEPAETEKAPAKKTTRKKPAKKAAPKKKAATKKKTTAKAAKETPEEVEE